MREIVARRGREIGRGESEREREIEKRTKSAIGRRVRDIRRHISRYRDRHTHINILHEIRNPAMVVGRPGSTPVSDPS